MKISATSDRRIISASLSQEVLGKHFEQPSSGKWQSSKKGTSPSQKHVQKQKNNPNIPKPIPSMYGILTYMYYQKSTIEANIPFMDGMGNGSSPFLLMNRLSDLVT